MKIQFDLDAAENRGKHTRTGIGIQDRDPFLTRLVLEEALLGAIVPRARQPRKINQQWHFMRGCRLGG